MNFKRAVNIFLGKASRREQHSIKHSSTTQQQQQGKMSEGKRNQLELKSTELDIKSIEKMAIKVKQWFFFWRQERWFWTVKVKPRRAGHFGTNHWPHRNRSGRNRCVRHFPFFSSLSLSHSSCLVIPSNRLALDVLFWEYKKIQADSLRNSSFARLIQLNSMALAGIWNWFQPKFNRFHNPSFVSVGLPNSNPRND